MDKEKQQAIKEKLAKTLGIEPDDLKEALADLVDSMPSGTGSDGLVHDYDNIMLFRCTETHHGPVLDRYGRRQTVRTRANELPSELMRVWVKGRIYPFHSIKQLPQKIEPVYERDAKGNILFMNDPRTRDPYADQVPVFKTVVDPNTGKRSKATQVSKENEGVQFFERVKLSPNVVQDFLNGGAVKGMENPVVVAKVDGNYVRHFNPVDAVPLTTAEKVALIEREESRLGSRTPVLAG